MKKVLITGATGLVGQEIVKQCHDQQIAVNYLSTSKLKLEDKPNYKGFYWNPSSGEIDVNCLKDVDVIINLAGATIAQRWTELAKQKILNSRLDSLKTLKSLLKNNTHSIKHIISASAIGIYPSSLTNYYDEAYAKVSSSFLGEVVEQWEQAADEFNELNIFVSKIRIGLVLDNKEGALPQIVKPVKLGFGAAFGSGEQWQSWIHKYDLAAIFMYVLKHKMTGIINGVAPNPITNLELTKAVADVEGKPLFLPKIPKIAMKLILGEMHILLFESQRVSSRKIEDHGFEFKYANIKPGLVDLLK
jgi:uncharacterized protein (TIGR01777 family)